MERHDSTASTDLEMALSPGAEHRLPVGMVEIGPGHAVRARDVCEVEHDHRSGETLIGLDFSGRQADAVSRLPYAEVMRRLRQEQLDELAEPGDPEVVHLLREALDSLPEPQRHTLTSSVTRMIRALYLPTAMPLAMPAAPARHPAEV